MHHHLYFQQTHGAPNADVRHVGDLGNIVAAGNGALTEIVIVDDEISLAQGVENGIIGETN